MSDSHQICENQVLNSIPTPPPLPALSTDWQGASGGSCVNVHKRMTFYCTQCLQSWVRGLVTVYRDPLRKVKSNTQQVGSHQRGKEANL